MKIFKLHISIILVILITIMTNCEFSSICETGYGEIVSEERILNEFSKIKLNINAEIFITQGEEQEVRISAQQNIINIIETHILNDELEIEFDDCVGFYDNIKIYITVSELKKISVSSAGSIYSDSEINIENLDIVIDGSGNVDLENLNVSNKVSSNINSSGNITLKGDETTENHNIEINGSGNIYSYGFPTNNVDIKITGSGNAYLNVFNDLNVQILSSGSVYYIGNPSVDIEINGSGRVINSN